jgi:hypothetical protein
MDDLSFLRSKIAEYADYRDQDARHLVDKEVRAYVGEAIARLRERLTPTGAAGDALDDLLMRCEFSDQRVIRAMDHGKFGDETLVDRIHELDRALIEAADRAEGVDAAGLSAYVDEVCALFERRFGAINTAQPT